MELSTDATMERLEDQIAWYDKKSSRSQRNYKVLKVVSLTAAALIPLLSGFHLPELPWGGNPTWLLGILGALIAVTEGVQQVNQYHANWIAYRATCEGLKHEKFLYLAKAGPYATSIHAHRLLAERIESLVSQEHAKWSSVQESTAKGNQGEAGDKREDVSSQPER